MGFLGTFVNALGAGTTAFREAMLNADTQQGAASLNFDAFGRWEARRTRYDLYWSLYQNNAYQDILHPGWATRYKTNFGLYKHIRHVYSPFYRIGEFWTNHLMGGGLDRNAGDGESEQSALPILADNEAIRPCIAKLWADSRWQTNKDVYTKYGSVLGDSAIKVVDDPKREQPRLKVVHPGHIKWVDTDEDGSVLSYILQEVRYDPRQQNIADLSPQLDPRTQQRTVIYIERAYLDGDVVRYQTLLNGIPYAWNGESAQWEEPYGFVPLFLCQHEPVGLDWGLSCFHSGLSRGREVDDQGSGLGDQIRKAIRGPWMLAGVRNQGDIKPSTPEPTVTNPEPDRSRMAYLTAPQGSTATPLVFPLDIEGVSNHIRMLNEDIEKNFPELLADSGAMAGTPTAEAIRAARRKAAGKVQARRVTYDDCLVRAQKAAIAIGGFRGYQGYEGFGLDSLFDGTLEHRIGHRPVFEVDPLDELNEDQAFWTAAGLAVKAGVPLEVFLERNGWSEEDLARLAQADEAATVRAMDRQRKLMMSDEPLNGDTVAQ